jgi:hypothetical protein
MNAPSSWATPRSELPPRDKLLNALADLRRAPFEVLNRYWPTDTPWRGEDALWGPLVTAARVWCYEGCYGCPPDSLALILWVQLRGLPYRRQRLRARRS